MKVLAVPLLKPKHKTITGKSQNYDALLEQRSVNVESLTVNKLSFHSLDLHGRDD
jgi:hypothetical protein